MIILTYINTLSLSDGGDKLRISGAQGSGSRQTLSNQSAPRVWDWLLVVIIWYIAFLCFDQAFDMRLTMLQSSDLLTCLFSGKFFDFYGYVLNKAGSGGYFAGTEFTTSAYYNILVYITLAVWALPVYLLDLVFHFSQYPILLNLWGRVLVITLSVISSIMITRISHRLIKDPAKSAWTGYYFLSSPILVYCVIIQDQIDIFSIVWMLAALFFYFDKKFYRFTALMSIAFCFKLFPILIFIPLMLLAEKKLSKLIQHAGIFVLPYFVTTFVFRMVSSGYMQSQTSINVSYNFFERLYAASIAGGVSNISIFIVLMILICVISYYARPAAVTFPALAFLLCSASLASFYIFVEWHSQWFLMIMPFLTLTIFSMKNFRLGVLLDICVTLVFLVISSILFLNANLMNRSILAEITSGSYILTDDFNIFRNWFDSNQNIMIPIMSIFAGSLSALILAACLDYRSTGSEINPFDHTIRIERSMLYVRALSILLLMGPPLVYYFSHPVR